jgi:Tol biopolymer transport system component
MSLLRPLPVLLVAVAACSLEPGALLPPRPPGSPLAYVSQGFAGRDDIFLLSADARSDSNLTAATSYESWPAWSPDGTQMAFESNRDDPFHTEIYVLTLGSPGGGAQRLTDDTGFTDAQPTWSPLGNRIAFVTNRDTVSYDIYLMDLSGGNLVRLTPDSSNETQPAWSPDGTQIAFATDRNGPYGEIYVMDTTGANVLRLTDNPASDLLPTWSPDGSKIAFQSDRDSIGFAVWVMNANGSNPVKVSPSNPQCGTPSWAPDGLRLAFDCDSDVWVANADGSGLTQITRTSFQRRYEILPRWQPVP